MKERMKENKNEMEKKREWIKRENREKERIERKRMKVIWRERE